MGVCVCVWSFPRLRMTTLVILLVDVRDTQNVRRMHTAVGLNEVIVERSHEAQLVIINLPGVPKSAAGDENCILFWYIHTQ